MGAMINFELIKETRKKKGLKQEDLAQLVTEASGNRMTQQAIAKIESGQSKKTAALPFICSALDLSYEEVTGLPGEAALTSGKNLFELLKKLPEKEQSAFFKLLALDSQNNNPAS